MARDAFAPTSPIFGQGRVARAGDVMIAFVLILITGPLMAFVCLAIKLESAGPVVYKIPRLGPGGRRFSLLIFRTTVHDTDPQSAANRDWGDRQTRVGQFLGRTRIEQLPQLINLLRGDISLLVSRN